MTDWQTRPQRIKQELPLQWTVQRLLGVNAPADGEMVSCPLPGHIDDTPSFNLWAVEDGAPQRWGCFGCGQNGDVVDLVQMTRGVGFGAALDICDDELIPEYKESGWQPTAVESRSSGPPEAAGIAAARLANMSEIGYRILERFGQAKAADSGRRGFSSSSFLEYAVREWDWCAAGPGENGIPVIAFPHRDVVGEVTGIKYRDPRLSGGRWSHPGSRFTELYGCWRQHGADSVLLCEGETDTVWAAYELREERGWDVLGLPSGAGQKPSADLVQLLLGRKLVVLAFDGDEPGRGAARRWREALGGAECRIVRLPEGEDLLSSGAGIKQTAERATLPRASLGDIDIVNGQFVRSVTRGQNTVQNPIADFSFEPVREMQTEDGPAWEVKLDDGRDALVRISDLSNLRTVTKWTDKYGLTFSGTASCVPLLRNWLTAESSYLPLEKAASRAGRIGGGGGRGYVWPGGSCGPERARYVPPQVGDAKLAGRYALEPGTWDPECIHALEALNDPSTSIAMISWFVATLLRGEQAPAPALFVSGEAGAGKTVMIETFLKTLGFPHVGWTLTTTTPYGVDCAVNSSISFPTWFDEYRPASREDSRTRLRQILRDAYNGQASVKGGQGEEKSALTEVQTWAGIIVSGEQGTQETSHMDRLVMLELDPDTRGRDALRFLKQPGVSDGMGRALLEHLATWPLFRVEPYGAATLPDRYRQTLGFLKAGWDAWRAFRRLAGLVDEPAEPDWAALAGQREEAEDPWLEILRHCDGKQAGADPIVQTVEGGIRLLPQEVIKEARLAGIILPAGSRELIRWLKKRHHGTAQVTRSFGGRRYWDVPGMTLDGEVAKWFEVVDSKNPS